MDSSNDMWYFNTYVAPKFTRADGTWNQDAFARDQQKRKRKREQNKAALVAKNARFGCLAKSGGQLVTRFDEDVGGGGADASSSSSGGGGGASAAAAGSSSSSSSSSSSGGNASSAVAAVRGNSGHFEALDDALVIALLTFVPVRTLRVGLARSCKRLHGKAMSSEAMGGLADMHIVSRGGKKHSAPTTAMLGALQRLNHDGGITRVKLAHNDFGKTTFKRLLKIVPLLADLDLGGCKRCYDQGCVDINVEAAPHLEVFRHNWGYSMRDQAAYGELLRGRAKLRVLDLHSGLVTDAVLRALAANCPRLQQLLLRGWSNVLHELTDDGVRALTEGCPDLARVVLSHNKSYGQDGTKQSGKLTPYSAIELLALPKMRELRLAGFLFDDFAFVSTSPATRDADAASAAKAARAGIAHIEAEDSDESDSSDSGADDNG